MLAGAQRSIWSADIVIIFSKTADRFGLLTREWTVIRRRGMPGEIIKRLQAGTQPVFRSPLPSRFPFLPTTQS